MSNRKVINNFRATSEAIRIARKRSRLKKKIMKGVIVAITVGLVGFGFGSVSKIMGSDSGNNIDVTIPVDDDDNEINIAADEILDLTLVNDGFDDTKFNEAVEELQATGLHCDGIDIDDFSLEGNDSYFVVAVTPYGGDSTKVIANYNDGNTGSDQLAVAMSVATGHDGTDIQKGVHDTERDNGMFKPSYLEDKLAGSLVSNITVAYPDDSAINTDEILEACARVTDYYKHDGTVYDKMLYRVKPGENYDSIEQEVAGISDLNKLDRNFLLSDDEILLRHSLRGSFSAEAVVNIEKQNEIDHTLQ